MINKNIIKVILKASNNDNKEAVLNELLNHISLSYDYNDNKAGHILEMLCDSKAIVKVTDVNVDYINKHLNLIMYNNEKYNIKDIEVTNVDNIECYVKVNYKYLEKINEDRDDVSYQSTCTTINFIDNPDILKK